LVGLLVTLLFLEYRAENSLGDVPLPAEIGTPIFATKFRERRSDRILSRVALSNAAAATEVRRKPATRAIDIL